MRLFSGRNAPLFYYYFHEVVNGADYFAFERLQARFRENETKKSPKELHYVFGEEASSYPCVCRIIKFRSDVVRPGWYLCATLPDHPQAGADEGGLAIANGHGDGRRYDEFAPIKGNGIGDAVGIVNSGYKATVGRGMLPALCSCWRDKQKAHCQGSQEG